MDEDYIPYAFHFLFHFPNSLLTAFIQSSSLKIYFFLNSIRVLFLLVVIINQQSCIWGEEKKTAPITLTIEKEKKKMANLLVYFQIAERQQQSEEVARKNGKSY